MNILYIFGNGFDKAQGMKTSYPEFYQYLMKKKGSIHLEQLKKDINDNNELWSDMEEALGKFTTQIFDASNFDDLYFELSDHLQNYLKNEEDNYNPSDQQKSKFIQDIINPFSYIGETDLNNLNYLHSIEKNYMLDPLNNVYNISFMTLNYTYTIEKLLPDDAVIENGNNPYDYNYNLEKNYYLRQLIHVHGQLNDSIIIGVDNEDQIANEQFRQNADIIDLLVKEQSNRVMGTTRQELCERLIKSADVIILYGVSLGATDAHWWNLIGKKFSEKELFIIQHIFKKDYTEVPPTRKQLYGRIKRENRINIMKKLGFGEDTETWPEGTNERLFFITNSNLFKL